MDSNFPHFVLWPAHKDSNRILTDWRELGLKDREVQMELIESAQFQSGTQWILRQEKKSAFFVGLKK